jgi:hypothetical protein
MMLPVVSEPVVVNNEYNSTYKIKGSKQGVKYFTKLATLDYFITLYKEHKGYKIFNCDPSLGPNFVNILGITFEYVFSDCFFKIHSKDYSLLDLKIIGDNLFEHMNSNNKKGYVTDSNIINPFMLEIAIHMSNMGFEDRLLGNNETVYTM